MLMSEENNQQEAFIGFAHGGDKIQIDFADGSFVISDETVALLGGTENLEKIAPALKTKTFGEFMAGVGTVKMKRDLNDIQRRVFVNHFSLMVY
jgi:hypothetical protein